MAGRNDLCGRRRPGAPRPGAKGPREKLEPKRPRKRQAGEGREKRTGEETGEGPSPSPGTCSLKPYVLRTLKLPRLSERVPEENDKRGVFAPAHRIRKRPQTVRARSGAAPSTARLSSRSRTPRPRGEHCLGSGSGKRRWSLLADAGSRAASGLCRRRRPLGAGRRLLGRPRLRSSKGRKTLGPGRVPGREGPERKT